MSAAPRRPRWRPIRARSRSTAGSATSPMSSSIASRIAAARHREEAALHDQSAIMVVRPRRCMALSHPSALSADRSCGTAWTSTATLICRAFHRAWTCVWRRSGSLRPPTSQTCRSGSAYRPVAPSPFLCMAIRDSNGAAANSASWFSFAPTSKTGTGFRSGWCRT
jgi:hypothetical protein